MISARIAITLLVASFSGFGFAHDPVIIHTIYGTDTITEPVLIELLNSKAVGRLQRIHQYGVLTDQDYTRYQHSVGVLYLLRRYGASLEEQVMGLLHDVSHTAFSHVADYLFDTVQHKYSYQDTIFEWFVEHTDLKPILERHNLLWITALEVRDQFKMLKDDLPKLCADRLEYNLYGGYLEGLLSVDDILAILDALEYRHGSWIFTDYTAAKKFADVVLYLSVNIWCADWNCYLYSETAKLLKHALDIKLISKDDLIFSDDATVWDRITLPEVYDSIIQQQLDRIMNYKTSFTHGTHDDNDYTTRGKFRWIDPFVMTKVGAQLLSTLDDEFAQEVERQKMRFKEPHYIRYTINV
jgi:HD superfamily phosphohydrolase